MSGTEPFEDALAAESAAVAEACVACGACFEACPTVPNAGLAGADPRKVTAGVVELLHGGEGTAEAERFASVCMGTGACLTVCDYGVNPRLMLSLARQAMNGAEARDRRQKGVSGFRKVAEGSRVLFRLLASPEERARVEAADDPPEPEVTFYTGCNVLKTPHIVLICLDVLDRLGVPAAVRGGPSSCCGVVHWRHGDASTAGRFAGATVDRLAAAGSDKVLAWCPTCQVQFSELNLPLHARASGPAGFAMEPFLPWLAARLDALTPHFTQPVRRRVGLHEHPGVKGVSEAAIAILQAIPGLDLVDLEQPRDGWMCNTLATLPQYKRDTHARLLQAAADAGVDTLCGVYHACHRDLCAHESEWPFSVVNIMELVGEAMGIVHEDRFKRFKALQDADAVLALVGDTAAREGLRPQEVRRVVERDLLGEQPLPLSGRARP